MKFNRLLLITGVSVILFGMNSCEGNKDTAKKSATSQDETPEITKPFNTTFDGRLFSIPSPMQTALLIKSLSIPFNELYLNDKDNIDKYTLPESKAINLGIYSADLGYISMYNQNTKTLNYISLIESLANDLGIAGAFDRDFMERFERNTNNEDSLLVIIGDGLRKADNFLKENKQKNISSLILTGGWVESMYIASQLNKLEKSEDILTRIGEQKLTLNTIIDLLEKYNTEGQNDEFLTLFRDLKVSFNEIKTSYQYVEPVTNKEKKMTTIKSKMTIEITDELAEEITNKISLIRDNVSKSTL